MHKPKVEMVKITEHFGISSETPLVDQEHFCLLAEASAEDPQFMSDLLSTFLGEAKPAVKKLTEACNSHDDNEIARLSHFLAGSSANLGLMRFPEICRKIESNVRNGAELDYDITSQLINDELELGVDRYNKAIASQV
ncbi:Hpt domain-containing protein [Rubellicoccus peritrichatus]|uniref:Hpt domain-containing protein n=1 Tax=Rubellicoccus peritrichatus TaxID=3080537 RepID=A0AAQ3QQ33_9BACT|nr:Hpt domain-containing protein [Puniceicoccus sp. CR14]WOO39788.1 Hpt domain-containing protein [Puniceicoccus sp. CR14]